MRALADELTTEEVDVIEAALISLGAVDSNTEKAIRHLRRQLAQSQAQKPKPTTAAEANIDLGFWGSKEESLLQRWSNEGEHGPDDPIRDEMSAASPEPTRAEIEEQVPAVDKERSPNLWEMWQSEVGDLSRPADRARSAPQGDGEIWNIGQSAGHVDQVRADEFALVDDSTSPSRIREYLARSVRPGRQAVVVDEPVAGVSSEQTRGRGRMRARLRAKSLEK